MSFADEPFNNTLGPTASYHWKTGYLDVWEQLFRRRSERFVDAVTRLREGGSDFLPNTVDLLHLLWLTRVNLFLEHIDHDQSRPG